MATPNEHVIYLLARLVSTQSGETIDKLLEDSGKFWQAIYKGELPKVLPEDIDRIYHLYPAKCPFRGANLGKCSKNKAQIERLCRLTNADDVYKRVKRYIEESVKEQVYLKNFATLLNNLPDYSDLSETEEPKEDSNNTFDWQ